MIIIAHDYCLAVEIGLGLAEPLGLEVSRGLLAHNMQPLGSAIQPSPFEGMSVLIASLHILFLAASSCRSTTPANHIYRSVPMCGHIRPSTQLLRQIG